MSRPVSLMVLTLCILVARPGLGQRAPLTATPNPASPGQTVTIVWHFVGNKIVLRGGRFGAGTNVSGRKSVTDKPRKTTHYVVEVWYRPEKDGQPPAPSAPQVHVSYELVVRVLATAPEPLTVYRDPYGWQVKCPKGWRHDVVRLPDPANNALVFFQKQQDSVERLAVSVMPAPDGGLEALMKKLRASVYTSYGDVRFVTDSATVHGGTSAAWLVFSGQDETHPGVATQSMVLALIQGPRAYLVSARTRASSFAARAPALEGMVRSFALSGGRTQSPAPHQVAPPVGSSGTAHPE